MSTRARKFKTMKLGEVEVTYPSIVPEEVIDSAISAVTHKYRNVWQVFFNEYQRPSARYNDWDLFGMLMDDDGSEFGLGVTSIETGYYPRTPTVDLYEG